MPTTFAERLARAMTVAGKNRNELAKVLRSTTGKMGISPSGIGQLLDGKSKSMTAENCARAARFLGVNSYWLATGEGSIAEPANLPLLAAEPAPLFENPEDLLGRFAALLARVPDTMRPSFADVLHAWVLTGGKGGQDDRTAALLQLLSAETTGPSAKRPAAARS